MTKDEWLAAAEGLFPEFTKTKPDHCEGFQGPCENTEARWGHTSTRYQDERSNWAYLCEECWEYCIEYWDEQWAEYRSMVF